MALLSLLCNKEESKKTRFIDTKSRQQIVRVDSEPDVKELHPSQLQMALLHDTYDAIIISDYNKGFIPDTKTTVILLAGILILKYLWIRKTKPPTEFSNVIYKINKKEFEALDPSNIPNGENMIVTLGDEGAVWNKKKFPVMISSEHLM